VRVTKSSALGMHTMRSTRGVLHLVFLPALLVTKPTLPHGRFPPRPLRTGTRCSRIQIPDRLKKLSGTMHRILPLVSVGDKGFEPYRFSTPFGYSGSRSSQNTTKGLRIRKRICLGTSFYVIAHCFRCELNLWAIRDSNPWPFPRQGNALPTELIARYKTST
jgi:hypothetical protein